VSPSGLSFRGKSPRGDAKLITFETASHDVCEPPSASHYAKPRLAKIPPVKAAPEPLGLFLRL